MTREQENELLRRDVHHYLWNKLRSKWTTEDRANLLKGAAKTADIKERKANATPGPSKQGVLFVPAVGKPQKYSSVVEASEFTGVSLSTLYSILNGHSKQPVTGNFYKK